MERALDTFHGTSREDMAKDTMKPKERTIRGPKVEFDEAGHPRIMGVRLTTAEDMQQDTYRPKDYPLAASVQDLEQEQSLTS